MFYKVIKNAAKFILSLFFTVKITGRENIVDDGPFIISSNHLSNYDPILISLMFQNHIHFLAKAELCNHRLTSWFFKKLRVIPVNRQSGIVIRPVRETLKLLQEGKVIGIFPEGTRVANGKEIEPKKGVAFFAVKSNVPVLPVAITFHKSKFRVRQKALINIGSPIDLSSRKTVDYKELASDILQQSRKLALKNNENEIILKNGQRSKLNNIFEIIPSLLKKS
ncbi:1-acyl-sn-glycerol-3-phosphate acyltransferase [Alteribacillus bidgolensis]|uniref:1-acyl-sn-glycerol-3-phosphate acyltransferase n=1 Tax=Alteribacillus bidgolensis TaxID=930129 RepID=A0A1G8CUY8_9BACI|nr:lysophospholipid acyltransferase family protein [Alteribacillus bidgolensis]SDH48760.1 1-acyl-sn-glycerol-3-phosphate acyltransferase [Alteribacillus bidgolensis]